MIEDKVCFRRLTDSNIVEYYKEDGKIFNCRQKHSTEKLQKIHQYSVQSWSPISVSHFVNNDVSACGKKVENIVMATISKKRTTCVECLEALNDDWI
ncbi:hypothetical protein vBAmePPT11V19_00080 [Alteromonas phage vB_AmeP_PT11-V19]|nr:hypothetical protein vBAmePPT11V19_00080 [Alteromonas phage vB_AmeP_PT11-V19]